MISAENRIKLFANPKILSSRVYLRLFHDYLLQFELDCIEAILNIAPNIYGEDDFVSVEVSFDSLYTFDETLCELVLTRADILLSLFNYALLDVQKEVCRAPAFGQKHGHGGHIKSKCHIRLINLPVKDRKFNKLIGQSSSSH